MTPIVLLGTPKTKRADYFQKAAAQAGVPCLLWEWGQPPPVLPAGSFVKIDPPVWDSCDLGELDGCIRGYRRDLKELSRLAAKNGWRFLNEPEAIWTLLDKRRCKETLAQAGLPVTEPLEPLGAPPILDSGQLIAKMTARRIFQVFIKPAYGSGAAGAAAFRIHPERGQMALYACAALEPSSGRLLNVKRLRRYSSPDQIFPLLDRILKLDCIVERWFAKPEYQGFSWDLRAVAQEGRLDFLLARLSKGPITNLHLNNRPLPANTLPIPPAKTDEIQTLCQRAMRCFPGLRSAGVDVLLEKRTLKPRIIEMNGQGDLIHQDIYGENAIYARQVRLMQEEMKA